MNKIYYITILYNILYDILLNGKKIILLALYMYVQKCELKCLIHFQLWKFRMFNSKINQVIIYSEK